MNIYNKTIAVVGLGYVGGPLYEEFSRKYKTIGFDIDSDPKTLDEANIYIVAVPTPIDQYNNPDLIPLLSASKTIGEHLHRGDVVIYESTVFPGCTEEECVPVLEKASGLKYNQDFYCGYSPERINPGDKVHTLTTIRKITSGSTPEVAQLVDELYKSIIDAGTYLAPSIKVAEAAKVVENCQRDLNISFMNELALICDRLGLDTNDVINAASTKWNFLPFRPGLVGGHCISVDPYYLVQKAESKGYKSQVILSGRAVNNSIAKFIADKVMKLMVEREKMLRGSKILILGITFKENCPDTRNTKVVDIIRELKDFGCKVTVIDPVANGEKVYEEYGVHIQKTFSQNEIETENYDAVIAAVAHDEFKALNWAPIHRSGAVIYDVKGILPREYVDARL